MMMMICLYYIIDIIASEASKENRPISTIHRPLTIPHAAWEGGGSPPLTPWWGHGRIGPLDLPMLLVGP